MKINSNLQLRPE